MAYTHFERLSALDLSFLAIEDGARHMHIGAVAIFEAGAAGTARRRHRHRPHPRA